MTKPKTIKLEDAEEPIRIALQRLAESPRELLCYVIINDTVTGRFCQFCAPPPPSLFIGGRGEQSEPLIFDGTGITNKQAYKPAHLPCDVDLGVAIALEAFTDLPPQAELSITEESTRKERPS